MEYKKYAIGVVLLLASFSIGRFSAPRSVTTKDSEHSEVKQNEDVNRNQNVVETTKETRLPDGTVVTETRKEKDTSTQIARETNTEIQKISSTQTEVRPSFRIGLGYEPAIKGFQDNTYSVTLEKRLFSEFYVGVSAGSRRTIGVTVSLGF